jgi:hypothetical protein
MKIAVLGLGESLKLYEPVYDYSIGMNDIWRYVKTDAVVCLDQPKGFTSERLKIINESTPKIFYSQVANWDNRPDFRKIDLLPNYPDKFCQLDFPALSKSFCSPFVAVEIAYKYHFADEIHLFGVDLLNHPHLNSEICNKIKLHFKNLKVALALKNCNLIIHGDGILANAL